MSKGIFPPDNPFWACPLAGGAGTEPPKPKQAAAILLYRVHIPLSHPADNPKLHRDAI